MGVSKIWSTFAQKSITMTKDELLQRLTDIEWDDFECKAALDKMPEDVWETVSAFSNTSGGWVVFGIKQHGKRFEVQGVNNGEKTESDFLNNLRNGQKFNFKLYPKTRKYDIDGKRILAFFVPSSAVKPIYFGNPVNTFIRSGSSDRRANEMEIAAMMRDQAFGSKSEMTIQGTSIADLSPSSLDSYRNYLRGFNPGLPFNDFDNETFCDRVGITVDGELTYGGLLMLGNADVVRRYVPNFWIDYIEIPGTSYADASIRYTYRMPELDNIWECYNVIYQRLRIYADNPYQANPDGNASEDESRLYALREGLVNLCAHSDYFSPAHPTIRVFTDRIMFQNPGKFMIDPNDVTQRLQSLPRNPTIIRLFRHARISDNGGYGIDKMLIWKKLTGKNVLFKTDLILTEVTFYCLDYDGTVPSLSPVDVPSSSPVVSSLAKICPQLNATQLEKAEKILNYLKSKNGSITDLMEVSGEKNKNRLRQKVLYPLIGAELIEPTIKETPNSPRQSYTLTEKAKIILRSASSSS